MHGGHPLMPDVMHCEIKMKVAPLSGSDYGGSLPGAPDR